MLACEDFTTVPQLGSQGATRVGNKSPFGLRMLNFLDSFTQRLQVSPESQPRRRRVCLTRVQKPVSGAGHF